VRDLEFNNAQDQLGRDAVYYKSRVVSLECASRALGPAGLCQPLPGTPSRVASVVQYETDLLALSQAAPDRILLIDRLHSVVYDSSSVGGAGGGQTIEPTQTIRTVSGEPYAQLNVTLDGTDMLGAAVGLTPSRDPLKAAALVVLRPRAAIAATAVQELLPRLLLAAGVSLLAALVLALLISRALTKPLSELAAAAKDIEGGNYSRRVSIEGGDEIGITGRAFNRMAAAVERARATQREFLANVSHELKTPLTSLIGFSQALVDGSVSGAEGQRRAATIIHEESERVLRMAQELLDLARVEGGHISFHPQPVDLGSMLQQEIDIVRRRADERGLKFELALAPALPPASADPERLHQILDNLLDNVVKYAPPLSRVTISATGDDQHVEVTVSNPVGDHRPDPERMFQRFYRADPSRAAAAGGVGLGLAISQELAQAMGGRLWADFDEHDWLRIRLTLPAGRRSAEQPTVTNTTLRLPRSA
jgi:signal transduction histidine kinase